MYHSHVLGKAYEFFFQLKYKEVTHELAFILSLYKTHLRITIHLSKFSKLHPILSYTTRNPHAWTLFSQISEAVLLDIQCLHTRGFLFWILHLLTMWPSENYLIFFITVSSPVGQFWKFSSIQQTFRVSIT